MSRSSSSAIRWCVFAALAALISAFAWTALAPASADAQATDSPAASLVVSDPVAEQPFRTAALALDAGTVGLSALSGNLTYDASAVSVISCDVSEAGACNSSEAGLVRMSAFNLNGLRDNDQLLTVKFQVVPGATGTTQFDFDVDEAVNFLAVTLPDITVASLDLVLTAPQFGSVTGDIVAADTQTGLFAIDVCAVNSATEAETCTTSTGLGTWRIDDLATGAYTVVVSDPAGTYASSTVAATISADTVTTGVDASLGYPTSEPEDAATDDTDSVAGPVTADPGSVVEESKLVIVYEASIAGRISDKATDQPLEGLTVCATQPLVLHQSCGPTDANGIYALGELSAGNYWITVVDPLGLYEEASGRLVGVVGDTGSRENVNLQLDRIAN